MTLRRTRARLAGAACLGYLLGAMPVADAASHLAGGDVHDLRRAGSGNPGATNAAAVLGRRWGAAVLAGDVAKGAAAAAAGRALAGPTGACLGATTAIGGHIVPVWSAGRGGKGVATSAGACLVVFPAAYPVLAIAGLTAAAVTRNAEQAMQVTALAWSAAGLVWWGRRLPNGWGPPPGRALAAFSVVGPAMVLTKFRLARRVAPGCGT